MKPPWILINFPLKQLIANKMAPPSKKSLIAIWIASFFMALFPCVESMPCFQNPTIFEPYTVYIQPISLENRYYYHIGGDAGEEDTLTVKSEENQPKFEELSYSYTCVEVYTENRMLVEVTAKGKTRYQCLQFEQLARFVVRQLKTRARSSRKKINCETDAYEADQAVLVALDQIKSQPCPLQGGYQIVPHEGNVVGAKCFDSVLNYNANIRFQCDKYNVVVDFGYHCEPSILRRFQKMRKRHIAHFQCVASWDETDDVKSVLFRMRDQPYDLWCMHYKQSNGTIGLLDIFLTMDGRCAKGLLHDEDLPRKTSLFGKMASYVAADDPRCSDSSYLQQCKDNKKCYWVDECPSSCKRCNYKPLKSQCSFMSDTVGHWSATDSRIDMNVDVTKETISVDKYGRFECRDEADKDLPGRVYPVVQSDEMSTCIPYYACASIISPNPGILQFKLYPAWRDEKDGTVFTCKETFDKIGYVTPVDDEKMITMLNSDALVQSPCEFGKSKMFPTMLKKCMFQIEECVETCDSLHVKLDNETCDEAYLAVPIINELECYGKLRFDNHVMGLLTYSPFSGRYYCLLYNNDNLYVSMSTDCNMERAKVIFHDREANVTYDPANRLGKPLTDSSGEPEVGRSKEVDNDDDDGNNAGIQLQNSILLISVGLVSTVMYGTGFH